MACHKLSHHQLDPYQHAAFQHSIVHRNFGEEEANPVLETAIEYAGALGTIVFDESCCLQDLTEAQMGRNQFTMDVVVVLGSAILPPSHVPERNLMVPYVVRPGLSFASEWLPLCFWTSYLITPFTYFTSVHLLICHSSLIPPIFLYVHLIYLDFLQICISCVIFPVLPSLYLSLVLCILNSLESTLLSSVPLVFSCPSLALT